MDRGIQLGLTPISMLRRFSEDFVVGVLFEADLKPNCKLLFLGDILEDCCEVSFLRCGTS